MNLMVKSRGAMLREAVHPLDDTGMSFRGQMWMLVVLVHGRDVVEDVLALFQHLARAVIEDDGELSGEGGIVGFAIGNGRGNELAAAILMLQTLTPERGAPGSRTHQEARAR